MTAPSGTGARGPLQGHTDPVSDPDEARTVASAEEAGEAGTRPGPGSAATDGKGTGSSATRAVQRHPVAAGMVLAAMGIVFGDIGTSPLYAMQTVFAIENHAVTPTHNDVMGIVSMIFWSITLIVCVKYLGLVLRADNEGEGGILALMALVRRLLADRRKLTATALMLGIIGAALFYGDSMITPAISVMSAIEGLSVVNPHAEEAVLPASVVILTVLFAVQRNGTSAIGRAFGPVMTVWFLTLAALGVPWIVRHPVILTALPPHWALRFAVDRPWMAFVAMGAVVLTITGAEALYADMGHLGAKPIRLAWFALVMPCLVLNYLGQGAMMLLHPEWVDNPFFRMAPSWATLPLVVIATMATIIASQAVISGTYSVSWQASRLGLLPRLGVRHTSKKEGGQIYIPEVNWILLSGVLILIAVFQSSARLATAYGLAVTGTLLLTTTLFLVLARHAWGWPRWLIVVCAVVIGGLEAIIFAANLLKIASGGWIPLVIAAAAIVMMTTWRTGTAFVAARRAEAEGPLQDFLDWVHEGDLTRVPGLAVYPPPRPGDHAAGTAVQPAVQPRPPRGERHRLHRQRERAPHPSRRPGHRHRPGRACRRHLVRRVPRGLLRLPGRPQGPAAGSRPDARAHRPPRQGHLLPVGGRRAPW